MAARTDRADDVDCDPGTGRARSGQRARSWCPHQAIVTSTASSANAPLMPLFLLMFDSHRQRFGGCAVAFFGSPAVSKRPVALRTDLAAGVPLSEGVRRVPERRVERPSGGEKGCDVAASTSSGGGKEGKVRTKTRDQLK